MSSDEESPALAVATLFHLVPTAGCGGATITLGLYKDQRAAIERHTRMTVGTTGRLGFPTQQVTANRQSLALILKGADGFLRRYRLVEPLWSRAWNMEKLGKGTYWGVDALERLEIAQARIASGGLRRRGERGKGKAALGGIHERTLIENLEAKILTRPEGCSRLSAAQQALALPDLLPNRIRKALKDIDEFGGDAKERKVAIRALEKDVVNVARDAEKAAKKTEPT